MPTIITKTIDASGNGDYTTFTAAEAAVSTIGTSADLVANDEAIVFECVAGTYNETLTIDSGTPGPALTTDATRNVTYKPAVGSEHGGVPGQGVRIQFGNLSLSSVCVGVNDPFTAVKGLEFDWTDSGGTGRPAETQNNIEGVTFSDCIIRSAGTGVVFSSVQSNTSDTQSFPVQVSDCVLDGSSAAGFRLWNSGASDKAWTVTNCTIRCGGRAFDLFSSTNDSTYTITNNLILSAAEDFRDQGGGGTNTVLGSNNFGPQTSATQVFPAALKGSPYPITATTNTSPGAGNWAIYDATTGALINVPDNSVIGEGTATGAPTTDINGEDRIRDTHADPGAFTTQLRTITKSIDGAGGGDYTTFTAAEAAVSTWPTDADMVKRNEAIVFEAEAGTYSGQFTPESSSPGPALTMDATRNTTYRAAVGSEHGGDKNSGVILTHTGLALYLRDDFVRIEGLVFRSTTTNTTFISIVRTGCVVDACIFVDDSATGQSSVIGINPSPDASNPIVLQNCLVIATGSRGLAIFGTGGYARWSNNTVLHTGYEQTYRSHNTTLTLEAYNNIGFGGNGVNMSTATVTGAGNVSGNGGQWATSISAGNQTWTSSTDPQAASTGSQVIYDASTGAMLNVPGNDAVGEGTATGAPTTDINGEDRIRDTHADPGAFTTQLRTITKSIDGSGGGDYTTFLAAEGAVSTWPTDADMVKRNEAIVFSAEAGTYDESLTIDSSSPGPALTTDATRNVTYKAAAGSEHGGASDAGVILYRNAAGQDGTRLQDDYTELRGLNLYQGLATAGRSPLFVFADGCVVDGCICTSLGSGAIGVQVHGASAAASLKLQNSVLDVSYTGLVAYSGNAHSVTALNVTTSAAITGRAFAFNDTQSAEFVNCLVLGPGAITTAGTVTLSGSNNFGSASNPFPAALQAGSQTWTFTTDTDETTSPSTGSQVVYDDETGRLYDVPGNDAWQILTDLTGVPATDIEGITRSASGYNPGAFEETATLGILATGTGALFSLSGISAALVSTDALGLADLSAIAGAAEAGASANAAAAASLSALRGAGAAGMAMQAVAQAAMATPSVGDTAAVVSLEAIGLATLRAIGSSASSVASLEAVGAAVLHALQSQGLVSLEVNGAAVASLSALRSAALGEVLLLPGPVTEVTLSTEALQAIVSPYIIIATDPNR